MSPANQRTLQVMHVACPLQSQSCWARAGPPSYHNLSESCKLAFLGRRLGLFGRRRALHARCLVVLLDYYALERLLAFAMRIRFYSMLQPELLESMKAVEPQSGLLVPVPGVLPLSLTS